MSLQIASLNSGSNGNCYYIGNDQEAILVDAGISCRETEKRMKRLGLQLGKISAIFISHEHSDHINGVETISKKYNLPIYITAKTLLHSGLSLAPSLAIDFIPFAPIQIGGLSITPFPKHHDAIDPFSFIISSKNTTVGVFTDIGKVCQNLQHYFSLCHAAFLETNYDKQMLLNGSYPIHLKKRIMDGNGHLSNSEALELFYRHRPSFMGHLLLSHLSKNNNSPELVYDLFQKKRGHTKIIIASRYEETPLYQIDNLTPESDPSKKWQASIQLSLFSS